MRLSYRRLGEGGIIFDHRTWKTHILTPAAVVVYDALQEANANHGGALSNQDACALLEQDLDLDINTPASQQLLRMLKHLGIIA